MLSVRTPGRLERKLMVNSSTPSKIEKMLHAGAGAMVFVMMLLLAGDVIARNMFHVSIPGHLEITGFLLLLSVGFSLSFVQAVRGHVFLGI